MSFWREITGKIGKLWSERNSADKTYAESTPRYAFVDVEVGVQDHKIHDIGSIRYDDAIFHCTSKKGLTDFLKDVEYLCGHNIIHHDAENLFKGEACPWILVDTLYISPLLFPEHPYHALVKDDKLISEQLNNPVNDCLKAKDLLFDEIAAWNSLIPEKKIIFTSLLKGKKEFDGFLRLVNAPDIECGIDNLIAKIYSGKVCANANLDAFIEKYPCELAYALALIGTEEFFSITPRWVLYNYPGVEFIMKALRYTMCVEGCEYCNKQLNVRFNLKEIFGYDNFRTYSGEPLQEEASRSAVNGKSLLAIFPTGGGKSLTFQLPALMAGRSLHGLTVVISPLQSLMKDQVDNLEERGITEAVTINGMLDPITRALSIQRVADGDAMILYISPEMLRSKTIERILLARNVVRFVIDEAHCFSAWGQDFRVDYLYIGKFIKKYQIKKGCLQPIPVSCFTATAKQKVIQDICDYFKKTLNIELELYASKASRTNLQYSVIHCNSNSEKYQRLRELISNADCPTIVYVSRTKRTRELAEKLTRDGFEALPFNGKMNSDDKIANQNSFMGDNVRVIVATSAFGMGVDKRDVGLVVHYDISDSLENYVQEAGRAGRDPNLKARCYVLYCNDDLDKHFILLNQTKLSLSEIQQVWKAVKEMTKERPNINCSALEIARQAGWDDSVSDIETRIRTALAALEESDYIERGDNVPHIYATGITVKNMDEARERICASMLFGTDEIEKAVRVIKSLISQKHISKSTDAEAESRVDYLADILGMNKKDVISVVGRMRQEGILADSKDISAFLTETGESRKKSQSLLDRFARLERYILNLIPDHKLKISCKQLNEKAVNEGISTSKEKDIHTLLYFLTVKGYTRKSEDASRNMVIIRNSDLETTIRRFEKRVEISRFVVEWLFRLAASNESNSAVQFSVVELLEDIKIGLRSLFGSLDDINLEDVEEALLYLSKIGALKLDGGFLVLYNAMNIRRKKETKSRYRLDDYRVLDAFYKQKIQQIHIVGEYANLMVKDYDAALQYVQDYFFMDYRKFIAKYFKGERLAEIQQNLTPRKYRQLFGGLSKRQMEIIENRDSKYIVVAAGPGSGKTKVLVHKLASLLLLEDVKHEQLLMLTFSRAAATEFKQRLMQLIGNAAHFVEIKTFHSYCFDLLGRVGNLDDAKKVVAVAAEMIVNGDVEPSRIGKTVLVVDEAQDMGCDEYALLKALMAKNEEMRIIAVGDDDQNIFEFRGSDSKYLYLLAQEPGSELVEMTENYRSAHRPVEFANAFLRKMNRRLKKSPIISMSESAGYVEVVRHVSRYMYQPIINSVLKNRDDGTTCILTQTNEEAALLVALLRKSGLSAKLIQSMDGFRFWNIAEIRYFLRYIDNRLNSSLIPDKLWDEAKRATFSMYDSSTSLVYIKNCISQFESTNKTKYISDFKEFVFESSVEDFCDIDIGDIVVSTIHKAKGREFDNVYMMLSDDYSKDDNLLRRYYVGMTRARKKLYIHTNEDFFNHICTDVCKDDGCQYEMPHDIILRLSHKDVYLKFFKDRKQDIISLRSGDSLLYNDFYLYNSKTNTPIARLSMKMQEKIMDWEKKGYRVKSGTVRFVVAWKPRDAGKGDSEIAVLLPDLLLSSDSD